MIHEHGEADDARAVDDALFEQIARPIRRRFVVSPIAMRIRLEKLGLLLREVPRQQLASGQPVTLFLRRM